jgi:hypothetical protein
MSEYISFVLGQAFNEKLGCFIRSVILCHRQAWPHQELKPRPRFNTGVCAIKLFRAMIYGFL